MKVITGLARGRQLESPIDEKTRPTIDRVKQSIFNIIQFDIPGRKVLDLFAGTGQLGIEALSRGAESAVFIDSSREAVKLIGRNLQKTGLSPKAKVLQCDFKDFLNPSLKGQFGVVFLDPPYGGTLMNEAVSRITQFDILAPGGIIICEQSKNDELNFTEKPYTLLKSYKYGTVKNYSTPQRRIKMHENLYLSGQF